MADNDFKILCIGKVCLDELLYCDSYPVEDTVLRVLDRKLSSGGNAGNNCKVLAELGVKSDLFGTLNINSTTGRSTLVVPWAEEGAAARSPEGTFFSPAFPPDKVVDTLGAGDTFCAGLMLALARGHTLEHSLRFACQVAGAKVGMRGFRGIGEALRQRGVRLE